jgi:hypothetical protein
MFWVLLEALFGSWVGAKAARYLSTDHRNDPVYKKNVQDLIERNRRFEKKE